MRGSSNHEPSFCHWYSQTFGYSWTRSEAAGRSRFAGHSVHLPVVLGISVSHPDVVGDRQREPTGMRVVEVIVARGSGQVRLRIHMPARPDVIGVIGRIEKSSRTISSNSRRRSWSVGNCSRNVIFGLTMHSVIKRR